jgi:hypothetical protein
MAFFIHYLASGKSIHARGKRIWEAVLAAFRAV